MSLTYLTECAVGFSDMTIYLCHNFSFKAKDHSDFQQLYHSNIGKLESFQKSFDEGQDNIKGIIHKLLT